MAPAEYNMTEEEAMERIISLLESLSPNELNRVSATLLTDEIHNSADPDATRREIFHELAKDHANGQSLPDGTASAICSRCGKRAKYRACAQCKSVTYCSVECQKADWKSHRPFCSADYGGVEGIEKKTLLLAERLLRHDDLHGNLLQIGCHELGLLQNRQKSQTHCARVLWDLIPVYSTHESKDRLMPF
ncbi:hypothetical protein PENSPDRAFT_64561 [Peniophora sp. CONT]|nr:hypothetical protein PENSPDRAFT_64561 [Peniophora sp. CONT]